MNEDQLKAILARNPAITLGYIDEQGRRNEVVDVHTSSDSIPASEPERRTPDALDEVVQGKETCQTRPIIRFKFYRTRLVDTDAVHAGAKDLLDGLVEAGLIPGDREEDIDFDARQEKVHYKKDERTEIELTLP